MKSAKYAIKEIARRENIAEEEVRKEVQSVIEKIWDTDGTLQALLFPEGKPDPETFIERIAKALE